MSKLRLGKQRTVRGAFSPDFKESKVTGLDRDGYNPSNNPRMVGGARNMPKPAGHLNIDSNRYNDIGEEGAGFSKPGFSGKVSSADNHPKTGGRSYVGSYGKSSKI